MSGRQTGQKKDDGWISWILIVALFFMGASPIALVLLFLKLFAPDEKRTGKAEIPYRENATQTAQTGTAQKDAPRAARAAREAMRAPQAKKSNASALKLVGVILIATGVLWLRGPLSALGGTDLWMSVYFWPVLQALAAAAGGMGMLLSGVAMDRALRRYPRYLAVLADRDCAETAELARKLGWSESRVRGDLCKMLERGYFGPRAYLDAESGRLYRSGRAEEQFRREQEQASAPPPREAEEGYSGILRNIRRANDRIADPILSRKIDRLEEITAKIFRAVEEDPAKRSRIHTLLDYYLPTTQKLLDAYAAFEETGVEGENLREAKERICATMDSIVAGFEHQLDELYRSDVLDVDSDIRVMETMLRRDMASAEHDFGLGAPPQPASPPQPPEQGGTAAQTAPEED